jgi:very-short-patch-repair endonuclease
MDAPPKTVRRARELRSAMTLPEVLLWVQLRRGQAGARFRRQHPIGPYILDFYCDDAKLAVEVDGAGHSMGDQPRLDDRRDAWLATKGIRVLRLPAKEVLDNLESVVATIAQAARP